MTLDQFLNTAIEILLIFGGVGLLYTALRRYDYWLTVGVLLAFFPCVGGMFLLLFTYGFFDVPNHSAPTTSVMATSW